MEYIAILNWEHYQHYKQPNPYWIKLYAKTLDSIAYYNLSDAGKLLFLTLLMLAAKKSNRIPNNRQWIKSRGLINGEINIDELLMIEPEPLIEIIDEVYTPIDESIPEKRREERENIDFDEFFPKKEQEPLEIHKTSFDRVEEAIRPLCDKFYELWLADGCSEPGPDLRRSWIAGARKWYGDLGGDTALLERAVRAMRADNLVIKSPQSCITKGYELKAIPPEKPFVEFD